MMKSSRISVILPVHNGDKFLDQAIQSCINQSYKNFELIIVNDFSDDRTLTIAEDWEKKDSRIKIINNSYNKKLPESLNVGHYSSEGDFITWTSDDNILKPDFLKKLHSKIQKEKCDIVFSNYDIIWEDGTYKREHVTGPINKLLLGDYIGASFLYRKQVFVDLGGYDSRLFLVEDYHFFLKASLKFKFQHLNENLYQYRIHQNSLTGKISRIDEYNKKHQKALRLMYEDLSAYTPLRKPTIDLILDLYFKKNSPLKSYLANLNIIKEDVCKYQNQLKGVNGKSSQYYMEEAIRISWISNKEEHYFSNLMEVIIKQKSLLGWKFNFNATLKLIYLCLRGNKVFPKII